MMTSYKSNPNTITCMCHGTWTGIWQNESHTLKKSNLTRECIPGFPFPLANPTFFHSRIPGNEAVLISPRTGKADIL